MYNYYECSGDGGDKCMKKNIANRPNQFNNEVHVFNTKGVMSFINASEKPCISAINNKTIYVQVLSIFLWKQLSY